MNPCVHRHCMLPLPQAQGNADLHKPRMSTRKRIQRFFISFLQIEKYQIELIDTQRLNIKKGKETGKHMDLYGYFRSKYFSSNSYKGSILLISDTAKGQI